MECICCVKNGVCDCAATSVNLNQQRCRRLAAAISEGDIAALDAVLAEDGDVIDLVVSVDGETALMRACRLHRPESVALLLDRGADPNRTDSTGKTALHHAAYTSSDEALALLLKEKRTLVNAVDDEGSTALHCTASPSWTIRDREKHLRCIVLLMQHPLFKVNRPDNLGQTALSTAVQLHYTERIQVMLEHGSGQLDVDHSRPLNGITVRKAITTRFPELRRLLPEPKMENSESRDPHIRLLAALQRGDIDTFFQILEQRDGITSKVDGFKCLDINYEYGDPYYCTCLELACRREGAEEFVKALLVAGANADTINPISRLPVVHQAIEAGRSPALEVLLNDGGALVGAKDAAGHTALHVAAQRICSRPEEIADMNRCISLLLDCDGAVCPRPGLAIDIDAQDRFGDTALHDAGHYGNRAAVLTLLRRGACPLIRNLEGDPPLEYIDAETFRVFLDEQLQSNGLSPQSEDYQVIFKYDFLRGCKAAKFMGAKEMEPLQHIGASEDLQHLLKHPVLMSYLHLKWFNVRVFFYTNLIVFTMFVLLMTTYIILISNKDAVKDFTKDCSLNSSCNGQRKVNSTVRAQYVRNWPPTVETTTVSDASEDPWITEEFVAVFCFRMALAWFIMFLAGRETIQFIASPRNYFRSVENILEVLLLVCSTTILCNTGMSPLAERHLAGITTLLLWTELIVMTGKLPFLSLQLEMLKKVCATFLRFMAWYSLLIIAFALSFFTMFRSGEDNSNAKEGKEFGPSFESPFLCVVRTVAMLAGEFEASSIPFDATPGTSHVVFVVFVFLITIVLLNLLNGLAVSDTHAIREHSVVLSLASMVRLLAFYETVLAKMAARFTSPDPLFRFLRQRLHLFDSNLTKQLHVFPATREVKFLSDAQTTERFGYFRMKRGVIRKAIAILKTAKDSSDIQQMAQRIDSCEKKIEKLIKSQKDMRSMVSNAISVLTSIKNNILD